MYKLLNKLFGWDYISWKNSADHGIARVFVLGDGRVAYWRYRGTKVLDVVSDAENVCWLTCSPDKYFRR